MSVSSVKLIDILAAAGVSELAVASTNVAYSRTIPMPFGRDFGLELKLSSGGTPDVKVELEVGNEELAEGEQGAANANYGVVKELTERSGNLADTNAHFLPCPPVVAKFMRLKFTGVGTNPATTKVARARLAYQEGL